MIPAEVKVSERAGTLSVSGPLGSLTLDVHAHMTVKVADNRVVVERPTDQPQDRALHGLTRSLIQNMVTGVVSGFTKTLEIVGVGYRAESTGGQLKMNVGFSHPVEYQPADGVEVTCPKPTTIVVTGIDKQKVGQTAAEIRAFRPPEPYKGKGIRYSGEHVRRKAGKTAARA